jgi:tryptophanyl-tRNA synthetase
VPEVQILKETAKVYDLQDPGAKMSKSAATDSGVLWLLDEPSKTAKKIKSAVTDADREVRFDRAEKAGVSNLLTIHSVLSGRSIADLEVEFEGRGYGDLKGAVAEVVSSEFAPIRDRALELLADPAELDRILGKAADRAAKIADATLAKVYDRVGFLPRR